MMWPSRPDDRQRPRPHELAAYLDGELEDAGRRRVECWLRNHPEDAAEVESLGRLDRLLQASRPNEPTPERWADVQGRIERDLYGQPPAAPVRWRLVGLLGAVSAMAAALLLAALLPHRARQIEPEPRETAAPFVIAEPGDVEINSLRLVDKVTLVVGVPPVQGCLPVATQKDVQIESIKPDADGMVPRVLSGDGSQAPIVLAPLDRQRPKRPAPGKK